MARPVPLTNMDYTASDLQRLMSKEKDGQVVRRHWRCFVWDTCDDITETCVKAWNFITNDPLRIKSIGTRAWARANQQGFWYEADYQPRRC
jgi:hypothetical protein